MAVRGQGVPLYADPTALPQPGSAMAALGSIAMGAPGTGTPAAALPTRGGADHGHQTTQPAPPKQQSPAPSHGRTAPGNGAGIAPQIGDAVNTIPMPEPPSSGTGTGGGSSSGGGYSGQAPMSAPAADYGMGLDIQSPAVQGLGAISNPEKFSQQINPEGWDVEAPPPLSVPGERDLPPSSRALATLAAQRGRVY